MAQLNQLPAEVTFSEDERMGYLECCMINNRKRYGVTVGQVVTHPDPVVVLFSWCATFETRWELTDSYRRFLEYCERHQFKAILSQANYRDYFKYPFEYVYKAVEESIKGEGVGEGGQGSEQPSFVLQWLLKHADELRGAPYMRFIAQTGHQWTVKGRDPYFDRVWEQFKILQGQQLDQLLTRLRQPR